MCDFGPYVGRQHFGKNAEIVRKTAKMKKLSKNREKLGSVKGSHSFIATQLPCHSILVGRGGVQKLLILPGIPSPPCGNLTQIPNIFDQNIFLS